MALMAGPALGIQYTLLYDGVKEIMVRNIIFRSLLQDLKSTLESLQPLFQDIDQHNNLVDQCRPEELEEFRSQLQKGVEIVHQCSKVRHWDFFKKHKFSRKLLQLNQSLQRLSNVLNVQVARDVKQSMLSVRNIENTIKMKCLSAIPEPPSFIIGLDKPLKEVRMKLINDEASMLVLTGPGGCGKTTLAKLFCHDEQVKDKFKENIFFVTISQKPNFELIIEQLYQRKGSQVPTFHNDGIAVTLLQQFLREEGKNPLLLVLDDVWPGSESILEKFDVKMPNYKILITSRSTFPRFGSPYYLESLNYENAMTLFRHSVSPADKSFYIPETLSRKIVEQCKGFPLAITMVGRSLCGQPVELWQKRVIEWSRGSILDSETELFLSLKSSLDVLDSGLKECFIDLGSFHQKISVAALVDMWIELYYDLEDEVLCIGNIYELTAKSLASLISPRKVEMEFDGYYTDHFVTQHDLLRELAIHLSKEQDPGQRERLIIKFVGDNTPKWWREQKFPTMKARLVSISTDRMFSMKWHDVNLPEAQVLVLNFEANNYVLPEFVEKMQILKVLIVTNYGSLPVELSNFQLLDSLSHLKRIRLECISIASITNNRIQLESLRKIALFKCSIGEAFSNCPLLISDAFPNLEEMNIDYCNDLVEMPDELCDLNHLKRLCITNCHKLFSLPEDIGKLFNLEVLRLRSCTGLNKLPGSFKNLQKLNLLDISGCICIEELHFGEMSSLRKINMEQCSTLQKLTPSTNLERLEEVICDEDTKALWEAFLPSSKIRVLKQEGKLETDSEILIES